jgi:hypothetical protein
VKKAEPKKKVTTKKKKKKKKTAEMNPEDERELILQEAVVYGFSLDDTGDLQKLRAELSKIKKDRQGKPLCYRRMFLAVDPRCRICDLRVACSGDEELEGVKPGDLTAIICEKCSVGALRVEIVDGENVVDYGCTTRNCTQTASQQGRFVPPDDKRRGMQVTTEELDRAILEYTRARNIVPVRWLYYDNCPGGKKRIDNRLSQLRKQGVLRWRAKKGHYLPLVDD